MALGSPQEFDDWAAGYDAEVRATSGFPFGRYDDVLREVVILAAAPPGSTVLDLGVGTGNLARLFQAAGCGVHGLDFSPGMLALARAKLPGACLARGDILGVWPDEIQRRYDRVVSAYSFHHFELTEKIDVLRRVARDTCRAGGSIVIGDVAFETLDALDEARERWADAWDEEHYWVAERDVPQLEKAGLRVRHRQVGDHAGVFTLAG
jgi:putative AdoMet-dependent methyltransferase